MSDTTKPTKRKLPAALEKFKFQKGHKRSPAASPKATVTAANAGAVTIRRHDSLLSWLGL
jgi:hypothetical protein